jgi:hypothetical protein
MLNILGEGSMDETTALVQKALSVPGAGIHWYGKAEAKKGTWHSPRFSAIVKVEYRFSAIAITTSTERRS